MKNKERKCANTLVFISVSVEDVVEFVNHRCCMLALMSDPSCRHQQFSFIICMLYLASYLRASCHATHLHESPSE